jgi:hypothetical protein
MPVPTDTTLEVLACRHGWRSASKPSALRFFRHSRLGGFALYAAVLLCVGGFFAIAFFFPQYFRMRSGIYRISCQEVRRKVETAVANHDANNTRTVVQPGKPIDLDLLKTMGFLAEIQYCPEGGRYSFGPAGEVLCSSHRPTPSGETPP